MIKGFIAAIQCFLIDLSNGLYCTRYIDVNRVLMIKRIDQSEIDPPVRIIAIHIDFLFDYSFFLLHICIRKVRILHKINECF
ncbi:hypothetical protein D3C80_1706300 [compost metagenome]